MTDRVEALATIIAPAPFAARLGLDDRRLRLRRAWPRDAGHLLCEHEAVDGRRVAGQWYADAAVLDRVAAATSARARHRDDVAVDAGRGLLLQGAGADRRLSALPGLVGRRGATLIVHRPERRAVVRLGAGDGARYAKVVRPDRVDALVTTVRAVAAGIALLRPSDRPTATAPLDLVDHHGGVVVTAALPGVALHDRLGDPRGAAAWWAAGEALGRLHRIPLRARRPVHDAGAEAAVLDRWLAHVRAHRPSLATAVEPAAAVARAALVEGSGGVEALVHRDWHDKNVLVDDDGRVGLLDLDTIAVGEPAVDLANAVVHLELRVLQGRCAAAAAAVRADALLAGYDPTPETRARLAAYAAATRVRLACVYAFRPGTDAGALLVGVARPPLPLTAGV